MGWRVVDESRSEGFKEFHAVWVPSIVRNSYFRYYDNGRYEFYREIIASFDSWAINQKLDPNTFRLEFPEGASVEDYVGGRRYVKGAISDAKLRDQAKVARTLLSESDEFDKELSADPFGHGPDLVWIGCVLVVATAGIGTGADFWLRQSRRARSK